MEGAIKEASPRARQVKWVIEWICRTNHETCEFVGSSIENEWAENFAFGHDLTWRKDVPLASNSANRCRQRTTRSQNPWPKGLGPFSSKPPMGSVI